MDITTGFYLHKCEVSKKDRLNDKQMKELIKEYQATNSTEKKEKIVKNSLYMVKTLAKVYCKNKIHYEDDYQAGVMGMLAAIETFDTERGIQWNTFATKCIRRAMSREFYKRQAANQTDYTLCSYEQENNKATGLENLIQDEQNIEEEVIEREYAKEMIQCAKEVLTAKEFEVLEYTYGLNGKEKKTYQQLAEQFGKSQSTIRNQVSYGIKKIKKAYVKGE